MQKELFFAPEGAQRQTPPQLAESLSGSDMAVRAEAMNGDWRLLFEGATGTYADLTTNSEGKAAYAAVHVGVMREMGDFRRLIAAFQQIGWTYCDSSYYEALPPP